MPTHARDAARPRDESGAARYRWRVAIVEDHLLQRLRVEDLIRAQPGLRVVWSGETLPQLLEWRARAPAARAPQLVVLDLMVDRGPHVDPDQVRRLIQAGVRIVVLSALSSPELVRKILDAGVAGVVGKRDAEADVIAAVWTVLGRGRWLTAELDSLLVEDAERPRLSDQEERALVLYASGMTLAKVAETLGVQKDTAKKYLGRVKAKYAALGREVRTKLDLNRAAQRDGYLDPPSADRDRRRGR